METTSKLVPSYVRVTIDGIQGTGEISQLFVRHDDIVNAKSADEQFVIYEQCQLVPDDMTEEDPNTDAKGRYVAYPNKCFKDTTMRINGSRLIVYNDDRPIPLEEWINTTNPFVKIYTKDGAGRYIAVYSKKCDVVSSIQHKNCHQALDTTFPGYLSDNQHGNHPKASHRIRVISNAGKILGAEIIPLDERTTKETIVVKYKEVMTDVNTYRTGYVLKKELDELFDADNHNGYDVNDLSIDVYKYKDATHRIGAFFIRDLDIELEYCLKDMINLSMSSKEE